MRRRQGWMMLLATVVAAGLAAPPAVAQAPSGSAPAPTKVNLTMEQRHIIKEIIINEMKVEPQPAEVPTRVGDVVPAGVPLQPIPVEVSAKVPQLKSHSFIVKNDAVLIVDPKDNRIAEAVN